MKTEYQHIDSVRKNHLKTEYDMTPEDYESLFQEQEGVCALCGLPPAVEVLVVDHDHQTRKIRGLIHRKCNTAIGFLNDDIELLKKAVKYLEKYAI